MEDREFFDLLYQQWSKTTGAENAYWMPEKIHEFSDASGNEVIWGISAVGDGEVKTPVADTEGVHTEADADFITAIHGCLPDLVRRLHNALDEADRLDLERDELVCRIAVLEMEADQR